MKRLQIHLLILSIFTIISGCNFSQQNQSKNIASETNQIQNDSDKLNDLFNAFLKKQAQIKLIRYEVRRIDTLVSGTIRNKTGIITIEQNTNDSIVGLSFYGKSNESLTEDFYIDNTFFKVYLEHKFYNKEEDFGNFVLGTTCGQLVLNDLIKLDTKCTESTLINIDNFNFAFKTVTNNDSSISTKQIVVDKKTLIPNLITLTKIHPQKNWKQSITFILTNVHINDQVTDNKLLNLYFKNGYGMSRRATKRSTDNLIGKRVPEIVLHTFKNESINIRKLNSHLILLDFWELWCSPCKKSLPTIEQIANSYKSTGLIVFGVISDTIKATEYVQKNNINLNQVIGNEELNSIFLIDSYPRYILIDGEGLIQNIFHGYSDNIELEINRLLFN